jgi:hypothetical protein
MQPELARALEALDEADEEGEEMEDEDLQAAGSEGPKSAAAREKGGGAKSAAGAGAGAGADASRPAMVTVSDLDALDDEFVLQVSVSVDKAPAVYYLCMRAGTGRSGNPWRFWW